MDNKDTLLGVLGTLYKWRKFILYTCLITAIGSAIISWFGLDNYYQSTSTFYAASPDMAKPEAVGQETVSKDYYGKEEDIDRLLSIAQSSEIARYIIDKYNLYEHYDIDTTHVKAPYFVRTEFGKLYNVKKTKFDAIEISVEDTDITFSAPMVNDIRDKINEIAQNIIKQSQWQEIETYQKNLKEGERELNILNDSLAIVRNKYGIYNSETGSEMLSSMASAAESKLILNKARKETLKGKGGSLRDTVALLNAMIAGQEQQVKALNDKLQLYNDGLSAVIALEEMHEEAGKQLSLSKERFKQLKIAHGSNITAIYVVEPGTKPLVKSRPRRSIICLAAVFIAFLFSIVGILIFDTYGDINWKEIRNAG